MYGWKNSEDPLPSPREATRKPRSIDCFFIVQVTHALSAETLVD